MLTACSSSSTPLLTCSADAAKSDWKDVAQACAEARAESLDAATALATATLSTDASCRCSRMASASWTTALVRCSCPARVTSSVCKARQDLRRSFE